MKLKSKPDACLRNSSGRSCCKLEAVLSVDERGQMVLPKELRERSGIQPGSKLALIGFEKEGVICCFALLKTEELSTLVQDFIGPLMQEITDKP